MWDILQKSEEEAESTSGNYNHHQIGEDANSVYGHPKSQDHFTWGARRYR